MIIPYKPRMIIAMLMASVITPISSYFFFYQLEHIINVDLYNYGLIFSNSWAHIYSFNAPLYLYSLTSAWFLFGGSIVLFTGYEINKKLRWSSICTSLLVVGAGLSIFNMYFLYQLDSMVNYDLYLYGLRYSVEWYSNYSLTLTVMYVLAAFEGIFALAAAILLYGSARKVSLVPAKLLDSILIAIGTAVLAFSIIYYSSILALIGLGLLFWGVTFTYVTTDDYVKKVLLDTTVAAQQATLNRMVQKLEYKGDTIYLPPQFFKMSNTYKAYIPKNKMETLPTAETLPKQKPDFLIDHIENPPAVLITPPGVELAQLFEKVLEKDFNKVSLQDLQQYLPELLIEDLEVAPYFDMEIENDLVRVIIDDSYFRVPRAEIELSSLYFFFGSPLTCAIACVLAKVTGKPVMIVNSRTEAKDKLVTVEYRILKNEP